ncbi:MAG: hypothetical protein MUE44_19060 [Oscillatoriaceae cyanobacterium Prado104]|jgi:WD40 repeat protein|nr:hypothetical protein [Oscillatoriaceae cyanobacterium Prado104]
MTQNPDRPTEYDAVLGGAAQIPTNAAVLGGIAGVKKRLASAIIEERIAAVGDAIKYGEAGLDLAIRALEDESDRVEKAAYLLLRERPESRVKEILKEYNPWRIGGRSYTFGWSLGSVISVAISPDGLTIVSASCDNTIRIWNLHTGELIRTIAAHSDLVGCAAMGPYGQTLVSRNNDNTIEVWNLHDGELIRTIGDRSDWVNCITICADGKTIVSAGNDRTIQVWEVP